MGWISENLTARTIVQLLSPRDGKGAGRGAKGEQRDGEAEDRDLGTGVGAGDRAGRAELLAHRQACPARWQTSGTPESGPALKAGRSGGRGLASETGPRPGW